MRITKKFVAALLLVLLTASAAFCADPFKVNKGGFGPKFKGLQLGQRISLSDLVKWRMKLVSGRESWEFAVSVFKPAALLERKGLVVRIYGNGKNLDNFKIAYAGEDFASFKNQEWTLDGLLSKIERNGFSHVSVGDVNRSLVTLGGNGRITKLLFEGQDFGDGTRKQDFLTKEFLLKFMEECGIQSLKPVRYGEWVYKPEDKSCLVYVLKSDYYGLVISVSPSD